MELSTLFSILGFGFLAYRLGPLLVSQSKAEPSAAFSKTAPLVSIIVPARNEEHNLPRLFASLAKLDYPAFEVIVVDDASSDGTAALAAAESHKNPRVQLVKSKEKPAGWVGKNWACETGAAVAKGEWLLFTDADTDHFPASLTRIMSLYSADADLVSALPYHLEETSYDSVTGPFQMMVFLSSSAFSRQTARRLFAIGQYLLFRRSAYEALGRHESVRASFAEDLDLAARCMALESRYALDRSGKVYGVRMYGSFKDFVAGWRRIFRQGLSRASIAVSLEIFFVIACLCVSFNFATTAPLEILLAAGGLVFIGLSQSKFGQFSWLGVLLTPLNLAFFIIITALALFDRFTGRELRWRGRSYTISS